MKLSTVSSLFGFVASAICFLVASDNLLLSVAASSSSELVEAIVVPDEAPEFDPEVNRLVLEGLDPSIPLTQGEAAFLELTIQDVFNAFHDEQGIDLWASSVAVGTHASLFNETLANAAATANATTTTNNNNNNNNNNNLRGGRQLERVHIGNPGPDINYCHYQSGPLKGTWKPGCEFDITLYICCRCWLCQDDDFTLGWSWRPTRRPTAKPTLSFQDQFLMGLDDDGLKDQISKKLQPTSKPTTAKPTMAPIAVVVTEEKGPEQPNIHPRPPPKKRNRNNRKGRRRNRRPSNKQFDRDVLNKLKNGPFDRFHNIRKVGFGYGN